MLHASVWVVIVWISAVTPAFFIVRVNTIFFEEVAQLDQDTFIPHFINHSPSHPAVKAIRSETLEVL